MKVIDLKNRAHIKMVRRIKQLTTTANQHAENGNHNGFKRYTSKAEALRHDLGKSLGIVRMHNGHIPFVSTMQGTCERVIIL